VVALNAFVGIEVLVGDGMGGFGAPIVSNCRTYETPVLADLNGDGHVDILGFYQKISLCFGDGTGHFVNSEWSSGTSAGVSGDIVAADLNNDGRPDLVIANYENLEVQINESAWVGSPTYGAGTAGCFGPQWIGAASIPKVGKSNFQLACDHAPESALGLGLVTNVSLASGGDPFGLGIELLVDLLASTAIYGFDFHSDALGLGTAPLPIPNNPALVGNTYYAQAIWAWPPACALTPYRLSSSVGLTLTIQ
jgi:hypothetical protein